MPSFYAFQRVTGTALLSWGTTTVVAGAAAQLAPSQIIKQIGGQALVWGAINAVIALFGLRDAEMRFWRGDDDAAQARRFRRIVAANAVLDLGYIAGGLVLVRRARRRPQSVGMGVGVAIQGVFLLLFDVALARLSGRWMADS